MSSRVARAVASNRQLQEVMTDFWENHFNVYVRKNAVEPYYLADYDRTIREHALGKFRDLLGAVAHSPAMLVYLDNAQSRANPGQPTLQPAGAMGRGRNGMDVEAIIQRRNLNPQQAARLRQAASKAKSAGLNENYGRELLELHTLGVDGGYTQSDVIDAARVLTGWTVTSAGTGRRIHLPPRMARRRHEDRARPQVQRRRRKGRRSASRHARAQSRDSAVHLGQARTPVRQRLAIDRTVDRATATYLRTDGDIREVVRTIVTSPEFFSAAAYHAKVKSPFEVVVSAERALGAQPDTTVRSALAVAYLGEPMFGHVAPNGYPDTGDQWMNTGAILNRINFGMAVAANRLPGTSVNTMPGAATLASASREAQVDAVVTSVLNGIVSPDTRKILLSGEHPLAASAAQAASAQQAPDPTAVAEDGDMQSTQMMNATPRVKGAGKANAVPGLARNANRNPIDRCAAAIEWLAAGGWTGTRLTRVPTAD